MRGARFVLTGGPGAGKTTLLRELARRGFHCVDETARALIRERLEHGLSPRPDPATFAESILERDIAAFDAVRDRAGWIFFDRSLFDAAAMCVEAEVITWDAAQRYLELYPFASVVFTLPPWQEIYVKDSERDQSFADAVRVYEGLARWYQALGFRCVDVPKDTISARADFVLDTVEQYAH